MAYLKKRILFLVYTILAFSCNPQIQNPLSGKVIAVKDGDSIEILDANYRKYTIRLYDIDCPELKQPFGQQAKKYTAAKCFGKTVKINFKGKDRYGRILGEVFIGNMSLNKDLVSAGFAWQYKHSKNKLIAGLEAEARESKRGLWLDKNPVPPWKFRKK